MACTDIPVSFLFDASPKTRGDFVLSLLNRISELKKLRKDISDELADLIGLLRSAEWLEAKRDKILEAVSGDSRQMRLEFTTKQAVDARTRAKAAA